MRAGARKQAMVPVGATVLEPVGTAPGLLVGSVAAGGRAAGAAARAADDVGRCGHGLPAVRSAGARRDAGAADPALLPAAGAADRGDAARARADACRSRSPPACGAGSSRWRPSSRPSAASSYAAFEASLRERHGDVLFSDDGATIDEVDRAAARRADDRHGRVLHRRADGRPADRPRGLLGLRARRPRRLLQRGQDRAGRRAGGVDRGPRGRFARGRHRAFARAPGRGWGPTSGSASRASPARAGPRRPSRWARSASPSRPRTTPRSAPSALPGGRADVRDRTTTVSLHMLRALLLRA